MSETNSIEYREIPGFIGYRIGTDCSVWTKWEKATGPGSFHKKCILGNEWKRMRVHLANNGYPVVGLRQNGKARPWSIARLMLMTFVGPCPEGMQACHFPDSNRANCRIENLRWDTSKGNHADRVFHGTHLRGETNGRAMLTSEQVRDIRRRYQEAKGSRKHVPMRFHKSIADEFGISIDTSRSIVIRRLWKYLD